MENLETLSARLEALKAQKGSGDEEQRQKEMKKIRREIRKLRGPVDTASDEEGGEAAPARVRKPRTKKTEGAVVEYAPTPELYNSFINLGLDDRRETDVLKNETGYMFVPVIMNDMDPQSPEAYLAKFEDRWPGLQPTWFTELVQGPSRCVVLGPVPNQ